MLVDWIFNGAVDYSLEGKTTSVCQDKKVALKKFHWQQQMVT
jgi:hypothetical protein